MLGRLSQGYQAALIKWASVISRRAVAVVVAAGIVTSALLYYSVENLAINTDTADMIAPDVSFRRHYEEFKHAFPHEIDSILVVVDGNSVEAAEAVVNVLAEVLSQRTDLIADVFQPMGGDFFARNGFLYLDQRALTDLADRLADAEPLLATLAEDPTLPGLFGLLGTAIDEVVRGDTEPRRLAEVLGAMVDVLDARLEGRYHPMSWRDLLAPNGKENSGRRLLLVKPKIDFTSLSPARPAMAAIRSAVSNLPPSLASEVRVRLTGSAALGQEELESAARGASVAGVVSLILVTMLLVWGLRQPWLVFATLISLLTGLVWTAAFAVAVIGHLTLISVAFAVLFVGLGVDFGIHFSLRYQEVVDTGAKRGEALAAAMVGVGSSLTVCAIAAAMGFYAFLPTDYRGLSELGLISGSGMFIALFASLTILPALLMLRPVRPPKRIAGPVLIGIERVLQRRAGLVVGVAVLVAIGSGTVVNGVWFDFNPLNLKDQKAESVIAFRDLERDSATKPFAISLLVENAASAAVIAERLEAVPEVDRALTMLSFVPEEQEEKLVIIDAMALFLGPITAPGTILPASTQVTRRKAVKAFAARLTALDGIKDRPLRDRGTRLARGLAALTMTQGDAGIAAYEAALVAYLPALFMRLRQALMAGPVSSETLPMDLQRRWISEDGRALVRITAVADILNDGENLRRFVAAVRERAPAATGAPVVVMEAGDAVVGALRGATIIAFLAISVLLLVLLRRPSDVALVLLPLGLAGLLTVATSVVMGLPFNYANVIVLPLLLGLGVAAGLHLVMRARNDHTSQLLRTTTPRAVFFSALTTIGSFGSLALSTHRGTASMGILLTIAIGYTLIATLVVLPALMALRQRLRGNRS